MTHQLVSNDEIMRYVECGAPRWPSPHVFTQQDASRSDSRDGGLEELAALVFRDMVQDIDQRHRPKLSLGRTLYARNDLKGKSVEALPSRHTLCARNGFG